MAKGMELVNIGPQNNYNVVEHVTEATQKNRMEGKEYEQTVHIYRKSAPDVSKYVFWDCRDTK